MELLAIFNAESKDSFFFIAIPFTVSEKLAKDELSRINRVIHLYGNKPFSSVNDLISSGKTRHAEMLIQRFFDLDTIPEHQKDKVSVFAVFHSLDNIPRHTWFEVKKQDQLEYNKNTLLKNRGHNFTSFVISELSKENSVEKNQNILSKLKNNEIKLLIKDTNGTISLGVKATDGRVLDLHKSELESLVNLAALFSVNNKAREDNNMSQHKKELIEHFSGSLVS